jgi:hypothetical protein
VKAESWDCKRGGGVKVKAVVASSGEGKKYCTKNWKVPRYGAL